MLLAVTIEMQSLNMQKREMLVQNCTVKVNCSIKGAFPADSKINRGIYIGPQKVNHGKAFGKTRQERRN